MKESHGVNVGDGERWIFGTHAVERRLRVDPRSIRTLYLGGHSAKRQELARLARQSGVAVDSADDAVLRRYSGSDVHQGVVALVTPFEYCDVVQLAKSRQPILMLDQIHDPQNLGALLRTAVAVGFAGVILPERGAASVTAAVEKAAAGAVNDIRIGRVVNLVRCLDQLADAGYWRLALMAGAGDSLFEVEMPQPLVLVLGGETGIRRLVREHCDLAASIPLPGPVESLNASVAGAVAMYEVLRRGMTPAGRSG